MIQVFKDFIDTRSDFINRRLLKGDDMIPDTPTLEYVGDDGYAVNRLQFRASAFHSQSDHPFAAMQWRIAEVTDTSSAEFDPREPRKYEINAAWDSGPITDFNDSITIPSDKLAPGGTYRVRVRMQDAIGYWSRWSAPVQFVAGPGKGPLVEGLRISEINYHPLDAPSGSAFNDEDFEFIEFQNVSDQAIDLAGVSLEVAVRLTLPAETPITLLPRERILVVASRAAFESRYGTSQRIAGEYQGNLNNGGDRIVVQTRDGELIQDFSYDDENDWPEGADGEGPTLEVVDARSSYDDPRNWRASRWPGGSPGSSSKVPGDANGDAVFNSADFVTVLQAGKYEDDIANNSTYEEGDWDGDGDFTSRDIVFAFQWESFEDVALALATLARQDTPTRA
jgi:hypothetical protein